MAYNVKFLKGTVEAYNALVTNQAFDLNTFYYVGEDNLYLGNIKLSNAEDLAAAILRIAKNETDIVGINAELAALTGSDSGKSINQMIETAVTNAKTELQVNITANTNAIAAEKARAEGEEGKLATRIETLETFKTEQIAANEEVNTAVEANTNAITAEVTRAKAAEEANATIIAEVKADVDAFFKDANMTETAKDTLKEIQAYMESDASAATELTASVNQAKADIDAIEADYLRAADKEALQASIALKADQTAVDGLNTKVGGLETNLATKADSTELDALAAEVAKKVDPSSIEEVMSQMETLAGDFSELSDMVGEIGDKVDIEGTVSAAIAGALTEAKTYADGLGTKYDKAGAATTAKTEAIADAEAKDAVVLQDAKDYADGLAVNYEVAGAAKTAQDNAVASAKTYTDNQLTAFESEVTTFVNNKAMAAFNDACAEAEDYTDAEIAKLDADKISAAVETGKGIQVQVVEQDGKITNVAVTGNYDNKYETKGAAATAKTEAKAYADSLAVNYDAVGTAASKANEAEVNAKNYVDAALTWGEI